MKEKALLEAIKFFGSRKALATALKVKPQIVNNWLNRGDNIPYEYAIILEDLTKGKVSVEQLSPKETLANKILKKQKERLGEASTKISMQQKIIQNLLNYNRSLLALTLELKPSGRERNH